MGPLVTLLSLLALNDPVSSAPLARTALGPYACVRVKGEYEDRGRTWQTDLALAFPDRVREVVTPAGGRATMRRAVLRFGKAMWVFEPGEGRSRVLPLAERPPLLARWTLEQALFTWPYGFAWEGDDSLRVARVDGNPRVDGNHGEVASLRARLDGEGRPIALEALDRRGRALYALDPVAWGEGGTDRPVSYTALRQGEAPRTVRVIEIDYPNLFDRFFMPADRRRVTRGIPTRHVSAFTWRAGVGRRQALGEGVSLEDALARAEAWAAQSPGNSPVIELDPGGRPVALWLQGPGPAAPPGWEALPDRPALGIVLASPAALTPADARALLRAASDRGRRGVTFFLRAKPPGQEPRRAELILTLDPP